MSLFAQSTNVIVMGASDDDDSDDVPRHVRERLDIPLATRPFFIYTYVTIVAWQA